jgi:uncharacterized membrane protein YuzA (DUF378 family)
VSPEGNRSGNCQVAFGGVFGLDFGQTNPATRVIYGLVGLSALYQVTQLRALCGRWAARRHAMAA